MEILLSLKGEIVEQTVAQTRQLKQQKAKKRQQTGMSVANLDLPPLCTLRQSHTLSQLRLARENGDVGEVGYWAARLRRKLKWKVTGKVTRKKRKSCGATNAGAKCQQRGASAGCREKKGFIFSRGRGLGHK